MKFSVVSPMAACGIYHNVKVAGSRDVPQIREDFKALVGEIGALAEAMGHPSPRTGGPEPGHPGRPGSGRLYLAETGSGCGQAL